MIIRSGFATQIDRSTLALRELKDDVDRSARVASSQLDVLDPSDAAGRWDRIFDLEDRLRDQSVYMRNSRTVQGALATAESALAEGTNLINEAREIAVQGASETLPDDQRAELATRIDGIRETLLGLANTDIAGRSLFAGTQFGTAAFDASGAYVGNTDEGRVVVGEGVEVRNSFVGDAIFTDALVALDDLSAALQSGPGSSDLVANQLTALDGARESLVRGRQGIGFDILDAQDAADLAGALELTLQSSLNDEVAADPFASLTEFSELQSTYQVALQVTAQVSSTSLFDFLR